MEVEILGILAALLFCGCVVETRQGQQALIPPSGNPTTPVLIINQTKIEQATCGDFPCERLNSTTGALLGIYEVQIGRIFNCSKLAEDVRLCHTSEIFAYNRGNRSDNFFAVGTTKKTDTGYEVTVQSGLPQDLEVRTIRHELCHVRQWRVGRSFNEAECFAAEAG